MTHRQLKALRVLHGVYGYKVATQAGMHPCTLTAIENGRKPLTQDVEERIVAAIRELAEYEVSPAV